MQRLHQNHRSLRFFRYSVAIAVGVALLAMSGSDLHAQKPDGPEFKFDPDKALIFKPDPNQSRKPFHYHPVNLSSQHNVSVPTER